MSHLVESICSQNGVQGPVPGLCGDCGLTCRWRNRYTILASCMHAGARIVEICRDESGEWSITVLAKFEEHKSMNYGSDVQPHGKNGSVKAIVSTSFYDKLLCLWRYEGTA